MVDVAINRVFIRLRDNEKLAFSPVPEADLRDDEKPPAKDYAEELVWNVSFDLDETQDGENQGLPVLHYEESLDTVSRKIASAAKTAIEESGTNMLTLFLASLNGMSLTIPNSRIWLPSSSSR